MPVSNPTEFVRESLADSGITISHVEERSFPGEQWLVTFVPSTSLASAQALAGSIEESLNENISADGTRYVVAFRATPEAIDADHSRTASGLERRNIDQLIQLLEARSRTSDALPSLRYVEDPRASLAAIGASRHHLVYGRRGVGKTALLVEAKRLADQQGHVTAWLNAHVMRDLDASEAFAFVAETVLTTLAVHGGSSSATAFTQLRSATQDLTESRKNKSVTPDLIRDRLPDLNQALRFVLREGLLRLFVFVDDFYLMPQAVQPKVLDYLAAMLRDCDGWIKVASIERLTRPYEPSSRTGLEVPHDASKIDLDVTLEDPAAAQRFLEAVLSNYTTTVGISHPNSIAKRAARGRLVLGSGGVPRDYLNLFASSIVAAREARAQSQKVGREDVAVAVGRSARGKKRDLELDVSSATAGELLTALDRLSASVKAEGYTYFRVDASQRSHRAYELLGQLADLRFAHLVNGALSDQHRGGTKYEVYVLDLSEFTDVRLKRGLNVLDLDNGRWTWRLTGKAGSVQQLTGTQLRDHLRQAPIVDVDSLAD